jgi:hypothetical protein
MGFYHKGGQGSWRVVQPNRKYSSVQSTTQFSYNDDISVDQHTQILKKNLQVNRKSRRQKDAMKQIQFWKKKKKKSLKKTPAGEAVPQLLIKFPAFHPIPRVNYLLHNSQSPVRILSHIISLHAFPSYFLEDQF